MSERDHMRKIFGFHPPMEGSKPAAPGPCRNCGGRGIEADYVGLEMRCVEVECSFCRGTGKKN